MTKLSVDSGDRPRALIVCPEPPYPLHGGGAFRTAAILNYLARRYRLDAVFFRQEDWPDPAASVPRGLIDESVTIDLPVHSRSLPARVLRNAGRLLRGVPPLVDRLEGHHAVLADFLGGRLYDLAVVEHFWCAGYAPALAPYCRRLVLDLHNIESLLFASRALISPWPFSAAHRRFAKATLALERRLLAFFDLVLVPSTVDQAHLCRRIPGVRTAVYHNTIPFAPIARPAAEFSIVFSGNMEYDPNMSAVRFFRNRIWPILSARHPGLTWKLVGRNPKFVRRYIQNDPRIVCTGPVEDSLSVIAASRVAVVPLLAGSGTRLKIIEAWAAGVPVVSTVLGAEGLPAVHGQLILLADTPAEFAAHVSSLLPAGGRPVPLSASIAAAARRLYEQEFTWERGWCMLENLGL